VVLSDTEIYFYFESMAKRIVDLREVWHSLCGTSATVINL
jgi:hypothetical protein